jgi:hypothetical protein
LTESIHEPLELYQSHFKELHAQHVSDYFEDLVRQSGVDENFNAKLVDELRQIEAALKSATLKARLITALLGLTALTLCILGGYIYLHFFWAWLLPLLGGFAPALYKIKQSMDHARADVKVIEQAREDKNAEAREQMAGLNQLFDWDIVAKLFKKTIPAISLDPYFSMKRLHELQQSFGWSNRFHKNRSILFAHSGSLHGNPLVIANTLEHWMGSKTYQGSLKISWTEQKRGLNGKWESVTRHQTLNASVDRPFPEYKERGFIIYGNEAAPDLSFSRSPSDLSKLKDSFIGRWKKGRAIKKLEAKSRKIENGKGFTVMSNGEFDALFGATDRDHEVQFRLLFTPLAQQEMLKLLQDDETGPGDTFYFTKNKKINIVESVQLNAAGVDGDPGRFRSLVLASARQFFNDYHNELFHSLYFGMAPLLAIPLYQQHRSHNNIYNIEQGTPSCFWEHESIANYLGEQKFQHPECDTRNILNAKSSSTEDGTQTVRIVASGYKGVSRKTYVSVYGDDKRHHDVPVHWTESLVVEKESTLLVREQGPRPSEDEHTAPENHEAEVHATFRKHKLEPHEIIVRRSIFAALLPGR